VHARQRCQGVPDPDASGEFRYGTKAGSSLDPSTAAWKKAIGACKDLQPPGALGDGKQSAQSREARLKFAQCLRDNGVKDFPHPTENGPLIDGCSEQAGVPGRGAEVPRCLGRRTGGPVKRKTWVLAGAAVLVALTATGGVVVMSGATQATPAAQEPPANTVKVGKGKLSDMVSQDGTLTYRARSDGSPYAVINQAHGTYTRLPDDGDKVDCGDVFYRVDDNPGAAAVWHGPGLPRPAQRRCGPGRPSAQPEPAQARLGRRRRCRYRSRRQRCHLADGEGTRGAPARQGL